MRIKDLITALQKYDTEKEIMLRIRKSQSKLAGVHQMGNGEIVLCNTGDGEQIITNRNLKE